MNKKLLMILAIIGMISTFAYSVLAEEEPGPAVVGVGSDNPAIICESQGIDPGQEFGQCVSEYAPEMAHRMHR